MTFTGFPDEAFRFYEGLEADNSKAYWSDHKTTYDEHVRAPMDALVAALAPAFGEAKVFRPHRDVRFSKDKRPYKTHQGAVVVESGGAFYVQVSAEGLLVAGGLYESAPDQVERFRTAVAGSPGSRLEEVVRTLRSGGWDVDGDRLKTVPRGYDAEHPRIELLRHRTLTASQPWGQASWVSTKACLARVTTAWSELRPLNEWLTAHVGSTTQARARR